MKVFDRDKYCSPKRAAATTTTTKMKLLKMLVWIVILRGILFISTFPYFVNSIHGGNSGLAGDIKRQKHQGSLVLADDLP